MDQNELLDQSQLLSPFERLVRAILEYNRVFITLSAIALGVLLVFYSGLGTLYSWKYFFIEEKLYAQALYLWSQTIVLFIIGYYLSKIVYYQIFTSQSVDNIATNIRLLIPLLLSLIIFLIL